jgi:hypothetical protein
VRRHLNRATTTIATQRQFQFSSSPNPKPQLGHDTTAQFCAVSPSTYAGRSMLRPYEEDSRSSARRLRRREPRTKNTRLTRLRHESTLGYFSLHK